MLRKEYRFLLFVTSEQKERKEWLSGFFCLFLVFCSAKNVTFLEYFILSLKLSESEYNKSGKFINRGVGILVPIWRKFPANG